MNRSIFIISIVTVMSLQGLTQNFVSEQKKNSRVRTAYAEKEAVVKKLLADKKIDNFNIDIYIRVFKYEKILELWAKPKADKNFIHITDYNICASSGQLGPKRQQGDGQTPEGFYYINRFNPYSNFYLSLGINFPNSADSKVIGNVNPGGDIFIHGNCVTIGCMPITDDKIKELYIFAIEAKSHGQAKVPVHIFPCKMTEARMAELKSLNSSNFTFWQSLKPAYDKFEVTPTVPVFTVDSKGNYVISK